MIVDIFQKTPNTDEDDRYIGVQYMLTKGATKAQQSKSIKSKNLPDPECQKRTKIVQLETTNEESNPNLENELDEENALNELAGEQDSSTDDDEVCVPFLQQLIPG